jgi:GT2 family glycosyltransferase
MGTDLGSRSDARLPWQTPLGRIRRLAVSAARMVRREGFRAFAGRLSYRLRYLDWKPRTPLDLQYEIWLRLNQPGPDELEAMAAEAQTWSERPLISLLMPVYNSEPHWLEDAVGSVLAQSYDRWQLCIVDDASPEPHVRPLLEELAARDPRIEVVHKELNGGIAAATQTALEMARGEFVGLVDHDDLLRPHALFSVAGRLRQDGRLDLVYSDEDKLLVSGQRGQPFFKPDWSPDLLLSGNYITHFTVIRRSVLEEAGGFRPGYDGSQDHDAFLRALERSREIGHIPDVLYTWRQTPGSAALTADAKPYAHEAGRRAVADALARRGCEARVDLSAPGRYDVRYRLRGRPRVTLIAWGGRSGDWAPGEQPNLDVELVRVPGSSWEALNRAALKAGGEHLVFVSARLRPDRPDWLEALIEQSQRPEVGAVGGRLLRRDGNVWQEGLGLGLRTAVAPLAYPSYFLLGETIRDVAAASVDCLATRRDLFAEMGGFSRDYAMAHADVDYCLRARERGLLIVYTHLALLRWSTRRPALRDDPRDTALLRSRWAPDGELTDPYVGPHIIPEGWVTLRLSAK